MRPGWERNFFASKNLSKGLGAFAAVGEAVPPLVLVDVPAETGVAAGGLVCTVLAGVLQPARIIHRAAGRQKRNCLMKYDLSLG